MHATAPFSIPAIRSFVPEKVKPWIIICFVAIFQLSGGVYLAAISQMVGSTTLMQEDIMMAGYASMVGMALTFTVMFRLKFRFPSKVAFTVCSVLQSRMHEYGLPAGVVRRMFCRRRIPHVGYIRMHVNHTAVADASA